MCVPLSHLRPLSGPHSLIYEMGMVIRALYTFWGVGGSEAGVEWLPGGQCVDAVNVLLPHLPCSCLCRVPTSE